MRTCTSRAPASRTIFTILRLVVPRTIESSTTTTRLPFTTWRTGFSFSFTPKCRIDAIERAGLAREHRLAAQVADEERAKAERVAHGDDRVLGEEEERVRPAYLGERRLDALERRRALFPGDQVEEQLRVARSLEDGALRLQFRADLLGVDQVPVVRDGDGTDGALEEERLRVLN